MGLADLPVLPCLAFYRPVLVRLVVGLLFVVCAVPATATAQTDDCTYGLRDALSGSPRRELHVRKGDDDRANEAFSQTIWWYNESLVERSPQDDSMASADPRPDGARGVLERRR